MDSKALIYLNWTVILKLASSRYAKTLGVETETRESVQSARLDDDDDDDELIA